MTLADLGSIGELVGAVGVIASLLYLGAQIRGARSLARAQSARELFDCVRSVQRAIATDPDLSRLWLEGLADFDSLSRVDCLRFSNLMNEHLLMFRHSQIAHREGILSDQDFEKLSGYVGALLNSRGGARLWESTASFYSIDVQNGLRSARAAVPDVFQAFPEIAPSPESGGAP